MTLNPKIIVKDFGPFEYADLTLKPLTILIGRNSVGKSMLSYLVWALASLMPNFEKLAEVLTKDEDIDELAKEIVSSVGRGVNPREKFKELLRMHIEAFPEAITSGLEEVLQKTFTSRLSGLVREGAERAVVSIVGPHANLELELRDEGIRVLSYEPYIRFVEELEVSVPRPNLLRITSLGKHLVDSPLTSISDLASVILKLLADYIIASFYPFFTFILTALLPDSRAGISRTLLKPYIRPTLVKGISYVDEQFIDLYFKLAEFINEGSVDIELLKPLLNELGCDLEVVFEGGVYNVYVGTWTGKRLPLPQAPSGIRESLTVALALASKREPELVIIEEPEAHLHPRAQYVFSRLLIRSINEMGKFVILTTHSDYVLYSINNLISLAQTLSKVKELGYLESEVISPDKVAAYLVKAEGSKAVLESLSIDSYGIPEDEFAKVSEELLEERSRIVS